MRASIEKYTLRFGTRGSVASVGSWAGKPTEFLPGGAALISNAAAPAQNTLNNTSADPIKLAGTKTSPITAIGLAPDSPIAELDLYFDGEATPHRIAIGAPFIGEIDQAVSLNAVPVRVLPAIIRVNPTEVLTPAQYRAWNVPWEMTTTEQFNFGGTQVIAPHPIAKINVYRGHTALAAITRRAATHAAAMWRTWLDGAVIAEPSLIVITDGRRRVRVQASRLDVASGGVAATLKVYGIEGYKTADGMSPALSDGRIDLPSFDELLAPTALADDPEIPTILDYEGSPYFAIVATIESAAAGARGMLQISCWDD
jgi:hypothetical protein